MRCRDMRRRGLAVGMTDAERKRVRREGELSRIDNALIAAASERLRLRRLNAWGKEG